MPTILTDTATTALWHDLLREARARAGRRWTRNWRPISSSC